MSDEGNATFEAKLWRISFIAYSVTLVACAVNVTLLFANWINT